MKRFLHLLTGICTLALALQACTKSPAENPGRTDDPGNDEQNSKVTLTLSTPRTRTTLVSETYVHWSEEDIVQINGTNLPVIPDPNDPTRATISNVDTAEEYVALYSPDNGGYIPEREVVEAYFRPEVPHTPDSFYTTGGNPMVAYSTSTSLEFKNIGGLLRIGVTGDASIASVMLSGNAGEPIAGHFEISKSDLASGSLDFAPGEGSAQFVSTSVTMTCTENVRLDANSPTYFYFALPAAEYTEGFTVTLTDSEGNTCLRQTHNSVSIERATLKSMEPIAFEKDKALTVTLGEIAANSVTWNIEGNPSTDLRTLLVTKAMWDHFIAQEYYLDNPQKLTSEILAAYSATIPTDDNGRYEETATQARAVNSMQPVQEDNDYLVLAAYFSGTQSVGVIPAPVPVHTPAATGPAPEVNVTVSSAGSTTIDVLTTTSNASGILTALFFKSDYDNVFSREGIDEELIAKYGNAWTAEQVEQANNGGYTLQYISLPPETEFVMLISVSSAAGKATLKKEIIATEPYVDPSAEWITVSSEATFVCSFFFNQSIPSLSNVINITNLKVEKLADRDLFRLTDAFSVSRIPELAASGIYSDLSGSPYYFYMDATDPNNVKVVNEVCQLGIVHNEYGAMSVGNDFNIQGGEEYQHGTYNRAEGTIRIGVLICYADSQQLFVTPFNSTLYLNPETPGNSVSTENFKKDPVAIPW